jgi:SAM-dependent methyltransferase
MQYDALAPIYDRLMDFVEYDEWVSLIVRAASRYGASRDPDILEIGAGTGVVGSILSGMGFRYAASDLSFPMCKEARGRRGLMTCVADARNLPFKKQFGMALFLYDGINYLLAIDDYRKLFSSVYDILVPGGLFLFDITTRENSLRHFTNYLDFEDYGDMSFVRHSYFDERKSIQRNDFTIYRRVDGDSTLYEKFVENHRQKLFSVAEIEKAIPKKRFDVLGIWDGYTFRRYSSRSIRIHFLLRKVGG